MRIDAYTPPVVDALPFHSSDRWELYRLLGEPIRLRLLALAAADELSVGELAEVLGEPQPNVSRHVSALRRALLLAERKQGTRVFVRLAPDAGGDAVIADALRAGRDLVSTDGSLARAAELVRARDDAARAFFANKGGEALAEDALAPELPTYLAALAPLVAPRRLAIDVGTGDGRLLDLLAPIFDRVIAFDRSEAQLARAEARRSARGYRNVELRAGDLDDDAFRSAIGGADLVVASRVLHHAPRPARTLAQLGALLAPGGALVVIDYVPHDDERLSTSQADLWLGFGASELVRLAGEAGLRDAAVHPLPAARGTPDAHLTWHGLFARRA